jgi:hypothetical protein
MLSMGGGHGRSWSFRAHGELAGEGKDDEGEEEAGVRLGGGMGRWGAMGGWGWCMLGLDLLLLRSLWCFMLNVRRKQQQEGEEKEREKKKKRKEKKKKEKGMENFLNLKISEK